MKLGDQKGCLFGDRIDLELSPNDTAKLLYHFKEQALIAKDYYDQGFWRKLKDYFEDRHLTWREERDKKDKEDSP